MKQRDAVCQTQQRLGCEASGRPKVFHDRVPDLRRAFMSRIGLAPFVGMSGMKPSDARRHNAGAGRETRATLHDAARRNPHLAAGKNTDKVSAEK